MCACNHLFAEEIVLFSLILMILQFSAGDLTTGFIQQYDVVNCKKISYIKRRLILLYFETLIILLLRFREITSMK